MVFVLLLFEQYIQLFHISKYTSKHPYSITRVIAFSK